MIQSANGRHQRIILFDFNTFFLSPGQEEAKLFQKPFKLGSSINFPFCCRKYLAIQIGQNCEHNSVLFTRKPYTWQRLTMDKQTLYLCFLGNNLLWSGLDDSKYCIILSSVKRTSYALRIDASTGTREILKPPVSGKHNWVAGGSSVWLTSCWGTLR